MRVHIGRCHNTGGIVTRKEPPSTERELSEIYLSYDFPFDVMVDRVYVDEWGKKGVVMSWYPGALLPVLCFIVFAFCVIVGSG